MKTLIQFTMYERIMHVIIDGIANEKTVKKYLQRIYPEGTLISFYYKAQL